MTEPPREEQKRPAWYEAWFDRDEYEVVYGHRDEEEAARLIRLVETTLALRRGARILDIGCGRGRHAIQLAERGYDVTGVDLSPRSIADARERARKVGVSVDFRVGDMREPVADAAFNVAVNLFTAFGYFEDEPEHETALSAMSHSLKVGGWLVQDFLNAERVKRCLVPSDTRTVNDVTITQERFIANGRIVKTIEMRRPEDVRSFRESVRLLEVGDFDRMYRRSGLILERVFGDYKGGPFTPDSPRLLMFARKWKRP